MQQIDTPPAQEQELIPLVVVQPGTLRTLHLGMYEGTMPEPKFRFELTPNEPDAVDLQVVRVDRGDAYELVCHAQSYSDEAVSLRVLARSA